MTKVVTSGKDEIAGHVDASRKAATTCVVLLTDPTDDVRIAQARGEAYKAQEAAVCALDMLAGQGARIIPGPVMGAIPPDKRDTPANRTLLAALEVAVKAAEAVDAERGLAGSFRLTDEDTFGLDLAEQINKIRTRVHLEVHSGTESSE